MLRNWVLNSLRWRYVARHLALCVRSMTVLINRSTHSNCSAEWEECHDAVGVPDVHRAQVNHVWSGYPDDHGKQWGEAHTGVANAENKSLFTQSWVNYHLSTSTSLNPLPNQNCYSIYLIFCPTIEQPTTSEKVYVFGSKGWSLYTGFTVFELFESLLLLYYWSNYFFQFSIGNRFV